MKLNDASRARLYALTCLATLIWLVQTITQSHADGTLFSWSSIIFILCIATVTVYCGYCAFTTWNTKHADDDNETESTEGATHKDH